MTRLGIVALPLLLLGAPSAGAAEPIATKAMQGAAGVFVVVEEITPDTERSGLSATAVQTDAELRLRQLGIKVFTEEEYQRRADVPMLYINVLVLRGAGEPEFMYHTEVSLNDIVHLARRPAVALPAQVWRSGGVIGRKVLRNAHAVRDTVRDQLDQFANAYLAANPARQQR